MLRKRIALLWLLIGLLLVSGCITINETPPGDADAPVCATPGDDTRLLEDAAAGYCFLYPATHTVMQTDGESVVLVVDSLLNVSDPRLDVRVTPTDQTLAQVADQVAADFAGFELARRDVEIDGEPAVVLDGVPGQDLNRRLLVVHAGRLYDLTFIPVGVDYGELSDRTEALYQTVVESFRFLPVTAEPAPALPDAVQAAQFLLRQQLQLGADAPMTVDYSAEEWSNSCLGVNLPGVMCAEVITPGYRVTITRPEGEYVYHTNGDGSAVQLAAAPEIPIADPVIAWQGPIDGLCHQATIGQEQAAVGLCGGAQMTVPLANPDRAAELLALRRQYTPFMSESLEGNLIFNGEGTTEATPAEQRMIDEWAANLALEAQAGRSGASWGLALAWHREGGIAGFCDDLAVYRYGHAYASTCAGATPETLAHAPLSAEQLAELYAYLDTYAPFEYEMRDPAVADAMTTRLVFSGNGTESADTATQEAIVAFAADLYTRLTIPVPHDEPSPSARFIDELSAAIAAGDRAALLRSIRDPFGFGFFASEWVTLTRAQAVLTLGPWLPTGAGATTELLQAQPAPFLLDINPYEMLGPSQADQAVLAVLRSTGWGESGSAEALLFIVQDGDGAAWSAVIIAPEGFDIYDN